MAKTFQEVFNEIKENVTVSKTGKKVKSWSRQDFNKMAKAFLNTPEYTFQKAVAKGDTYETVDVMPVKEFRKMIQSILKDFGVDKAESERVLTETELVKNADAMYELVSELIYQYLAADKKFDFVQRADFSGAIKLKDIEEITSVHRNVQDGSEIKINKKAHKVLDKQSKAPKWLKSRVK